jgi:hypothetical protein
MRRAGPSREAGTRKRQKQAGTVLFGRPAVLRRRGEAATCCVRHAHCSLTCVLHMRLVSGRAVSTTRGACRTARADEVGTHAQLPS